MTSSGPSITCESSFKSFMGVKLLPVLSLLARRAEVALSAMPVAMGGSGAGAANFTLQRRFYANNRRQLSAPLLGLFFVLNDWATHA